MGGSSEHQDTLSYCESDQALTQIAQGDCGISILGVIQMLYEQDSGQLSLGSPA